MLSRRSSRRSIVMRPSARASGAPGHVCAPWPNAMCWRALARSTWNSAGHSNRRGSWLAAPFTTITVVPAGTVTPPTLGGDAREAEVALHRALDAQALLHEVRDEVAVRRAAVAGGRGRRRCAGARCRTGAPWSPGRPRRGWPRCARRRSARGPCRRGTSRSAMPVITSVRGSRRRSSMYSVNCS